MDKKLTIAIPTFNRPNAIKINLRHLIAGGYHQNDRIDLLISDNGSTPSVREHLSDLIPHFKNITLIRIPLNLGFNANIFNLIRHVKTDYFILLSDEDSIRPGFESILDDQDITMEGNWLIVTRFDGANPQGQVQFPRKVEPFEFRIAASYITGLIFFVPALRSFIAKYAHYFLHQDNPYPHTLFALYAAIRRKATFSSITCTLQLTEETPMSIGMGFSEEKMRSSYWSPNSRLIQFIFFNAFLADLEENEHDLDPKLISSGKQWLNSSIYQLLKNSLSLANKDAGTAVEHGALLAAIANFAGKEIKLGNGKVYKILQC
jgi:glycosyltransferase involved in cell wall biosynthesis